MPAVTWWWSDERLHDSVSTVIKENNDSCRVLVFMNVMLWIENKIKERKRIINIPNSWHIRFLCHLINNTVLEFSSDWYKLIVYAVSI